MPFEIVRNDITNMRVDAIVNAANPKPIVGYGVDSGVHQKAGPLLLAARKEIGEIAVGAAAITPAFGLDAKYVIHTVSPVWQGGANNEIAMLESCYTRSLQLALQHGCESIAFPLLSAGNHGFPKDLALQTAVQAFSSFLLQHEMQIYLVVFSRNALALSERLFRSIQSFIDEKYIRDKSLDEYGVTDKRDVKEDELRQLYEHMEELRRKEAERNRAAAEKAQSAGKRTINAFDSLDTIMMVADESFAESLLRIIDEKGLKDPDVYKKANIDRKLFSKIKNNKEYHPSKADCLSFAIALELDLEETKALIGKAGHALTYSSKFDIIIEYFITKKIYDFFKINEVLFSYGLPELCG